MASKKKTSQTTLVTFLLDRSGSMQTIKAATIEGFNAYLAGLKAEKNAKIDFTFLQFDHSGHGAAIEKVYVAEPIGEVAELNDTTFQPRGGTPLIEAAFKTIKATETAIEKRGDNPKVVVCIQTDGEENQSGREYSWAGLSALVKEKTEKGWQFNFMGAGIDAYDQGAKMGFSTANTMSYNSADLGQTRQAFRSSSINAAQFATGAMQNTNYSDSQKMAAGDQYAKYTAVDLTQNPTPQVNVTKPKADLDLTSSS